MKFGQKKLNDTSSPIILLIWSSTINKFAYGLSTGQGHITKVPPISKTWSCRSFSSSLSQFTSSTVFLQLNRLYLLNNLVVHEPPPPPPDVGISLVLLVPLPVIHLPRQDLGPDGARQVWVRTARVKIYIFMGVPTPEPVED